MKLFGMIKKKKKEETTCLHCGEGKPIYCEECFQDLIAINLGLQLRLQAEKLIDGE